MSDDTTEKPFAATPAPEPQNPAIPAGASPRRQGFLRSSVIYSGLTLVSRFMGAARDIVISAKLGASSTPAADALNTALAFPNLFRRVFAEGAFASAFVPAYSRSLTADGEAVADQLASDALATLAAATIIICIAAQFAMPWLMFVINPGYVHDPIKFNLAVVLTQISMPYLPCMAVTALLSGVLNARSRFILSAGAPTWNAAMLVAVLPQTDPIMAAKAASIATFAAGVAQAGMLWWGCWRTGAKITLRRPRLTPEIKKLIGLAIPGTIAASVTQINIFISGILASQTPGARSWLAVADRLYQLPLSLVGVAIGIAILPRLSQAIQAGDDADAQTVSDQALLFSMAVSLPAAAALSAMPFYLIDGLWTRGQFTVHDAHFTADALFYYGLGVPAFVLNRILQPAFFARQDTRSPMRFALLSVAVNIGLGISLFYVIGFAGIAAATAVASWLTTAQLAITLWRRGHYRPSAFAWQRLGRIGIASAGMAAALWAAEHFRARIEAPLQGFHHFGLGPKEVAILGVSLAGAVLYAVLLLAFRGLTLTELRQAFRRARGTPEAAALPSGD